MISLSTFLLLSICSSLVIAVDFTKCQLEELPIESLDDSYECTQLEVPAIYHFYNPQLKKCESISTLCKYDKNLTFQSSSDCRDKCDEYELIETRKKDFETLPDVMNFNSALAMLKSKMPDKCVNHVPYTGPCRASFQQYYFDFETETCQPYIYGGCGARLRVDTRYDCYKICMLPMMTKKTDIPNEIN
ncbi:hypothetical protein SNEBB_011186 [Seison nebaliae]|nr:hypothetical protein SNEBB_011186 [Seison nebaliae]